MRAVGPRTVVRRRWVLIAALIALVIAATYDPDRFLSQFRRTDRTVLTRLTGEQTRSDVRPVLVGGGWYRTKYGQPLPAGDAPAVNCDRWQSGGDWLFVCYDADGRVAAAYFGDSHFSHYEPTLWDWLFFPSRVREASAR